MRASPAGPIQQTVARSVINSVQPDSIVYKSLNDQIMDAGQLVLDIPMNPLIFNQSFREIYRGNNPCGAQGQLVLGGVVHSGAHLGWAAAMDAGDKIDSKLVFYTGNALLTSFWVDQCQHIDNTSGYWLNGGIKYLGFKLQIHGRAHYGWAVLSVELHCSRPQPFCSMLTNVTGYAYQTIPDKSILAGQK